MTVPKRMTLLLAGGTVKTVPYGAMEENQQSTTLKILDFSRYSEFYK